MSGNKSVLYIYFVVSLVLSFISGFLLKQSFESAPALTSSQVQQPSLEKITSVPNLENDVTNPLFQKEFFRDTYIGISKSMPYQTVVLTIDRTEKDRGFSQMTKILYFDGKNWSKGEDLKSNINNDISFNNLLKSLNEASKNNGSMSASMAISKNTLSLTSENLGSEVTINSNGLGGQFIYQGPGHLSINGQELESNVFHSREFSFDASTIGYLQSSRHPLGQAVFWDKEKNFYFFERFNNQTISKEDLSIGIRIDSKNLVSRSLKAKERIVSLKSTDEIRIIFEEKVNDQLRIPVVTQKNGNKNSLDLSAVSAGIGKIIKREGRTIPGVGFSEIH